MAEWYDDPDGNGALPVYQYLIFNARDISDTDINFRFFGRLGTDLISQSIIASPGFPLELARPSRKIPFDESRRNKF